MSSESEFAYSQLVKTTCFVVQNITDLTDSPKTVSIFNVPIPLDREYDLLKIAGVQESDIRASLLKGTLRQKILAKEIRVTCSNIDLLQFDETHKKFLQDAGIIDGLEISGSDGYTEISYLWRMEKRLIGIQDGVNRVFYTPEPFLNGTIPSGDSLHIEIFHNGRRLIDGIDYTIGQTSPSINGYDMITFKYTIPIAQSQVIINYAILN